MKFVLITFVALASMAQNGSAPDDSARVVTVAEPPDSRIRQELKIAPGPPPLLSFRYYQGAEHHRFGNLDLMMDDAGH